MNYFDKLQQNIIREEFARAAMINRAKSVLNESQFDYFMNELRDYEDNLVLTESNQNEMKYSGLAERLVLNESAGQRIKNAIKGFIDKVAPNNQQKLSKLADELDALMLGEIPVGKKMGDIAGKEALKVKAAGLVDQIKQLSPEAGKVIAQEYGIGAEYVGKKMKGGEQGGDVPDAGDMAKDPKAKAAADKVEDQADAVEDKLENPKAKGIFSSIVDSYKYAFAANAKMWKNVFGFFTKAERSPPRRQDDMMMMLLMQLMQMMQNQNVPGKPQQPLTPQTVKPEIDKDEDGGDGGDDDGGGDDTEEQAEEAGEKEYKVANIQDKIILALNKVLDFKNVDLSRKDTMELAKTLTKNLVDQMVANGIKFKGMSSKVNEVILKKLNERVMLSEQEEEKKEKFDPLKRLISSRIKRFKNPKEFLDALRKVKREFIDKEYGEKMVFKKYVNTDVEQEFVGVYDLYLDIKGLEGAEKILNKQAKKGDESAKNALKQADNMTIKIGDKVEKGRKLSSLKVHFANFYQIAHDKSLSPEHPSEVKKYRNLKIKGGRLRAGGKDAKDLYKPEKVDTPELPSGKKGMINVKNLIFQALKGLQMDSEQVQDIEKMLNKRLQGVVKQYIAKGMEINVLEEKITRYANSVVKQLNERK